VDNKPAEQKVIPLSEMYFKVPAPRAKVLYDKVIEAVTTSKGDNEYFPKVAAIVVNSATEGHYVWFSAGCARTRMFQASAAILGTVSELLKNKVKK
jgi:hypothetical protein